MPYKDKDAQREYQRNWVARRRAAWIDANGPCVKCGSTIDLQVDHIDPATKVYEPTTVWSLRAELREAELAKCQVLCKQCHDEKTSKWYENLRDHGYLMYNHHKCRCDVCKAANAERSRWQREMY